MSNELAPYTHHLRTCARVTDADDCNCGLNDAITVTRSWQPRVKAFIGPKYTPLEIDRVRSGRNLLNAEDAC